MSAEHTLGAMVFGLVLWSSGAACAAEEDVPDIEMLEYLGMWEESDEDWLIFDKAVTADNEKPGDPAPQGEESVEKDDDS